MKKIIILATLVVAGCAHPPIYTITASTPSYIEADGVIVCDSTPCDINPQYRKTGLICDDIHYVETILTAFPIDKSQGFVQHKTIKSKCGEQKRTVYFDMKATGGVQTVTPRETTK